MPSRAKKLVAHDRTIHSINGSGSGSGSGSSNDSGHSSSSSISTPSATSLGAATLTFKSKPSNSGLNQVNGFYSANGSIGRPSPSENFVRIDGHSARDVDASTVNGSVDEMGSGQSYPNRRAMTTSASSEDDVEARGRGSDEFGHCNQPEPLRIDVSRCGRQQQQQQQQQQTSTKQQQQQQHRHGQKSKLAMATTILSACPLWDVIAILIILLQLPTTIVSVVHFLFAAMTFVPPTTGTSLNNLPRLQDTIVGSAGGSSLQTILTMDLLMLLLFVPLWSPAQNIALDLAQAVIAISLGGAAASKGGTTNSVLCCVGIVAASHLLRWRPARQLGLNLFWSGLVRYGFQTDMSPPSLPDYHDRLYASHGWPRCLLGVHILAQGVLRIVRRYLLWREANTEPSTTKKVDPEVGSSPTSSTPRLSGSSSSADLHNEIIGSNGSTDGRPPGPSSSSTRDGGKERTISGKKKKKQATHVRMQQPFWAALASTKVTVLKEYEQSQASTDANEAESVDATNMGNVDFKSLRDRVWITEIGATEILFGVCLPVSEFASDESSKEPEVMEWYVKVNGAPWISTKRRLAEQVVLGNEILDVWEARIYGLTPLSPYHCEFVREHDHTLIYDSNLITQPAPSTDSLTITSPTPALRPSSPVSTLRTSILAAEVESEKSKNNLKTARKQHKTALERLQSQIDRERSKLANNGGSDERQRQRAKQLENSIVKLRGEHDEAEKALTDLGEIPADVKESYERAKSEAKNSRKRRDERKSSFDRNKKQADKGVSSVKADIEAVLHKRARFETRQKEYANKLAEATKKKDQALKTQTTRQRERVEIADRRRQEQAHLESVIADLDRQMAEESKKHTATIQAIQPYDECFRRLQSQSSAPGTPETKSLLPLLNASSSSLSPSALTALTTAPRSGSRPSSLHAQAPGFTPGFQFPPPIGSSPAFNGYRQRSSSMEGGDESPSMFHAQPVSGSHGFNGFATSNSTPYHSLSSFAPLSASGITSLSAMSNGSFPNFVSTIVGAEKERKRKSSGDSHGSNGSSPGAGMNQVNGSPGFGSHLAKALESNLRSGMVSPVSTGWDREKDKLDGKWY